MRTAFFQTLLELARADDRIMFLTGDLGFGVVEQLQRELPNQFVNVGVAEQNMAGLAAGLALSGRTVFMYSIANFPVLRCLEQIRNDICYHQANVKIVSVGGGMSYGSLGISHHATEDLAIMRSLPNLVIVAPGDPVETRLATLALSELPGPAYLRLGRAGETTLHQSIPDFGIGRAMQLRDGDDVTLVSTGGILKETLLAAAELANSGIQARVLSMPTVKPIDREALAAAVRETTALCTVEEHSIIGGLGGAVAELLLESEVRPRRFARIGLPAQFSSVVGDQDYLRHHYKLDAIGIANQVRALLESR